MKDKIDRIVWFHVTISKIMCVHTLDAVAILKLRCSRLLSIYRYGYVPKLMKICQQILQLQWRLCWTMRYACIIQSCLTYICCRRISWISAVNVYCKWLRTNSVCSTFSSHAPFSRCGRSAPFDSTATRTTRISRSLPDGKRRYSTDGQYYTNMDWSR